MKLINIKSALAILILSSTLLSCEKDDSKMDYGFSKIFMPQSINKSGGVNNYYPVPSGSDSSTFNYQVNRQTNKIDIILGATLSGPAKDAYSVELKADNDTIQKLLNANVFDPASYILMPASMYTLPSNLSVGEGSKAGSFYLSVDIAQLKSPAYAGKYLLLAVKLANPSKYELNQPLSSTIVVVDVNALVVGPAVNVTAKYILNPGNPFIASAMNGTRWGTLQDWKTNAAIISHGGVGGFSNDGDGKTIDLETGWGSPAILNGKLYQTITLPKGTYSFDPSGGSWKWQGTKDPCYIVVAPNADTLPDFANIANNSAIVYERIASPQKPVTFELSSSTKVSLGLVVNYVQDQQGIKSTQVSLYNYPKHL